MSAIKLKENQVVEVLETGGAIGTLAKELKTIITN